MYEVKRGKRDVWGEKITTYTREVVGANILEVEAGTNGSQGGDAGHGSRCYIRIENVSSTAWEIKTKFHAEGLKEIELILGGDYERETIITALKFILEALEGDA